MQTYAEQKDWFETQRNTLLEAVEREDFGTWLEGFGALEQRVLCLFARQAVSDKDWPGRSLDKLVETARHGIELCLRQSEAEADEELRARRIDTANVISYNLAADLADCWADDGYERAREHFETGLAAAERCVQWRTELGKPPHAHSLAWWAKGMHELSLERNEDARASFARSLEFAREAAEGDTSAFGVILGTGYLGMAETLCDDEVGRERYQAAISAFEAQLDDDERKADASFGLEQLRCVEDRYTS